MYGSGSCPANMDGHSWLRVLYTPHRARNLRLTVVVGDCPYAALGGALLYALVYLTVRKQISALAGASGIGFFLVFAVPLLTLYSGGCVFIESPTNRHSWPSGI